ncbi:hypothetical protein AAKU64_000961, partial [Undibacterium sp. GrIS 1.8]
MSEVHLGLQMRCDGLMPCKFPAVIERDGMAVLLMWREQLLDAGSNPLRVFAMML